MSQCLSAPSSVSSGLSHTTKRAQPALKMRVGDQVLHPGGISLAHQASIVAKLNRAYSKPTNTLVPNHTSGGLTLQQAILDSYGLTTWGDRSFDASECDTDDRSALPDQLDSQRLRNLWWQADEPSEQQPNSDVGLNTDRPIERLLQQQGDLTLHSYELSSSKASQVEGGADASGRADVTVSQQQVDAAQEDADSSGQEVSEESDGYGLEGEQEAAPAPMFNNAFRDILAGALNRQKALMQEDEEANDAWVASAAFQSVTPLPIERSASEETIATSLAVSKVTLARMMEVRKEMDTAIIRETKQVERLAFALQKIRTDAAYYRTLEAMSGRRPEAGSGSVDWQ